MNTSPTRRRASPGAPPRWTPDPPRSAGPDIASGGSAPPRPEWLRWAARDGSPLPGRSGRPSLRWFPPPPGRGSGRRHPGTPGARHGPWRVGNKCPPRGCSPPGPRPGGGSPGAGRAARVSRLLAPDGQVRLGQPQIPPGRTPGLGVLHGPHGFTPAGPSGRARRCGSCGSGAAGVSGGRPPARGCPEARPIPRSPWPGGALW